MIQIKTEQTDIKTLVFYGRAVRGGKGEANLKLVSRDVKCLM
jgi:hypothetical protein